MFVTEYTCLYVSSCSSLRRLVMYAKTWLDECFMFVSLSCYHCCVISLRQHTTRQKSTTMKVIQSFALLSNYVSLMLTCDCTVSFTVSLLTVSRSVESVYQVQIPSTTSSVAPNQKGWVVWVCQSSAVPVNVTRNYQSINQ